VAPTATNVVHGGTMDISGYKPMPSCATEIEVQPLMGRCHEIDNCAQEIEGIISNIKFKLFGVSDQRCPVKCGEEVPSIELLVERIAVAVNDAHRELTAISQRIGN
jgi:hypothetical protein